MFIISSLAVLVKTRGGSIIPIMSHVYHSEGEPWLSLWGWVMAIILRVSHVPHSEDESCPPYLISWWVMAIILSVSHGQLRTHFVKFLFRCKVNTKCGNGNTGKKHCFWMQPCDFALRNETNQMHTFTSQFQISISHQHNLYGNVFSFSFP